MPRTPARQLRSKLPAAKKPQSRPELTVVRDSTFHRAVADKVLAIDLGRDVEFAFLQSGPIVKKMIDWDEQSEQAQLEGSLTEVARIRVFGPVALTLAVNVIETFVRAGKVKTPALMKSLAAIVAEHESVEEEAE